jgi:hypothetical protein
MMIHRRNAYLTTPMSQSLRHLQRYAAWTVGGIALTGILMGIATHPDYGTSEPALNAEVK